MVKRLRDLNNSIKRRVIFDRDEALNALEEGISEQRENLVEEPANDDIDIRRVSQQYDRDEENRRFVRTELSKMQNQNKRISFGQAFKNARNSGKKTFWWKGKEYNTKLKREANAGKSVTNKKTNTTNNTSSNKNVSNVANNKQNNTTTNKKSVSLEVLERKRLNNRNNQLNSANDFTAYQNYRNNYNDSKARTYLANARKKQQNNFTKDELDAIRKAEQNKKKRGY